MVSRGVHQLKNLRLYFCDIGGSSAGVRQILKSADLSSFMENHQALTLQVFLKRGSHPYLSSTFINGYVKDIHLRNTT